MSILSLLFLAYVAGIVILYNLFPARWQKYLLLAANAAFVLQFGKWNALLLFGLILWSYVLGQILQTRQGQKVIFIFSICSSLAPLLLFKYTPCNLSGILVPVGISFYTFRVISYLAEIYLGRLEHRNLIEYAIYISFFPTLLSGPIDRPQDFFPQICKSSKTTENDLKYGFLRMLYGYILKMVIADRLAMIVNEVFTNWSQYSGFALFFTSFLYTLQIYCDFSGYTYIASGVARLLGLETHSNFIQPYFAVNVTDFWRRWHVSLSSWLRDYIYIPLGGNRKGSFRKYINLMITFLVSGLWHGAGIKFVFWGGVHGFLQIAGSVTKNARNKIRKKMRIYGSIWEKMISVLITFVIINYTWILFWGTSFRTSIHIIIKSLKPSAITFGWIRELGITDTQIIVLILALLLLCLVDLMKEKGLEVCQLFYQLILPVRWILLILGIVVVIVFGAYGAGYDASSFIYFKF